MHGVFYGQEGGDKAQVYAWRSAGGYHWLSGDNEMEQGGAGGIYGLVLAAVAVYDGHVRGGGIFS